MDKERIERAVREILIAIGEDPDREGLLETPKRVAMMYEEVFMGLENDPEQHLKIFNEEKNEEISHDELTVADIESSAKDYYNANHADDIEDKVKELCDLANTEFSDDGTETALGGAVEEYLDEKIRKEKKL